MKNYKLFLWGMWIIGLYQVSVLAIFPFFLFYQIATTDGGEITSYYFNYSLLWAYCMILVSFTFFGFICNLVIFCIRTKKAKFIRPIVILISVLPSVVMFFPGLLLYLDPSCQESYTFDLQNYNNKYNKVGRHGLWIFNLVIIVWLLYVILLPSGFNFFITKKVELTITKMSSETFLTIVSLFIASLTSFWLGLLALNSKNKKVQLYVSIISYFLALSFLSGVIFPVLLLTSLRGEVQKFFNC
ncbi:hypothetical protein [Spiroplasma sp. SV19]|uniref:hypothetical protein n=1 Tax=Spiroplasma sp. SV19 TaxID=2570468 RepID=UPI0024B7D6B9|nr:hypothetical protein [Spiroplasma sp. SV19]WHQ37474.1 hypothetical protein E7Y35_06475 [Spiroplasma sp. SV19]